MSELLQEIASILRLTYISDLNIYPSKDKICKAIMEVRGDYPAKDWQDAVSYITGKNFPVDGPVVAATLVRFHK